MDQYGLVGFDAIDEIAEQMLANAAVYRFCGVAPPNLSVAIEPGGGRTTLLWHIVDLFEGSGLFRFTGVDKLQEYTLDGSMAQLYSVRREVYTSIIGREIKAFDATALKSHLNERQTAVFLEMIRDLSRENMLVFFWPIEQDRNTRLLAQRVSDIVPDLRVVPPITYSDDDLTTIALGMLKGKNIALSGSDNAMRSALKARIARQGASVPKDLERTVRDCLPYCVMYHGKPLLTARALSELPPAPLCAIGETREVVTK